MACLALDIGGANLKASDGERFAISRSFALWQSPDRLANELTQLLADAPNHSRIAITMTGELADCFATKGEGVRFIIAAVLDAAKRRAVRIYQTDGQLVPPDVATAQPRLAAASNWHALASFACRKVESGYGFLVDVGSTTADIIALSAGGPVAVGKTDTERLASGELVYTGIERTPLCAAGIDRLPYRGQTVSIARELFATMRDVYLALGELPEMPSDNNTADGRPATRSAAAARLARMICADPEDFSEVDAIAMAQSFRDTQIAELASSIERVCQRLPAPPQVAIVCGQGEFLIRHVLERAGMDVEQVSLAATLGPDLSRCAPAYALANLARELWDSAVGKESTS